MKKKALLGVLTLVSAFALASCGSDDTTNTDQPKQTDKDDSGGKDNVVVKHTVTVTKSDDAAGSVTGAGQFNEGANVTLTATTNAGYVFLGFFKGDTKVSEQSTYSFKLDADTALTAKWRALAEYAVTVNVNEANAGSVTGAGNVQEGSSVTLTATTNPGYLFLGFYDSADNLVNAEATYTFTPTADVTLSAKYRALDQYAVIVSNANEAAGSITGAGNVQEGESVTLTATVNPGYTFLGFYDGETRVSDANATTYTFTPTADTTYTAKWLVQEFDFEVQIVEAGDGSVETGDVSYTDDDDDNNKYKTNEVIKLTATPRTGYQFKGWYVGDTFLSNQDYEYEFTMLPQNTVVKAVFEDKQCGITIHTNFDDPAEYIVTVEGDDDEYDLSDTFLYGSEITITVNAETGLTFKRFYTLDEDGNKVTFDATDYVIEDDIVIYAEFEADKVEVSATLEITSDKPQPTSAVANITVVDADGNPDANDEYEYKSMITVELSNLDSGFTFDGWYIYNPDDDDADENGYVLYSLEESFDYYVKADAEENDFVARVTPKTVSVTIVNETPELGAINIESGDFEYLEVLELETTPITGYKLSSITISGVDNPYTDDVDYQITSLENVTITVSFEIDSFEIDNYINVSSSLDDSITDAFYGANDGVYEFNSEVTLTAPELTGYTFVGWFAGNLSEKEYVGMTALSNEPTWTFTKDENDIVVTACYSRNKYFVEYTIETGMSIKDENGDEIGGRALEYGLDYTLDIPEVDQYTFIYWYYKDRSTGTIKSIALTDENGDSLKPWDLDLDNDLILYAKMEKGVVFATFDTAGGSEVTSQPVTIGHAVEEPDEPTREGYKFTGWYTTADGDNKWNFASPISNPVTIYAHWEILSFKLTVESADSSIVAVNSEINGEYEYGTKLILTATISDPGYSFTGWEVNGEIISNPDAVNFEYTIPADNTVIKATYKVNTYTISGTTSNWANTATVSFDKTNRVYSYKDTVKVTIKPQAGYYPQYVYLNGVSISFTGNDTDGYTATFAMPSKNSTVSVSMQCRRYTYTVSKNVPEGNAPYFLDSTYATHQTSYTTYWAWKKTFVAEDIEGYTFQGWYDKDTNKLISNDATTLTYVVAQRSTLIGPKNANIEARYTANTYALTVTKDVNGAVTSMHSGDLVYKGTYALKTEAITGYTFKGWFVNGSDTPISTSLSYTYTMPAGDTSIVAKFAINKYNVYTNSKSGNTTWTIAPGKSTISYNDSTYTVNKTFYTSLEYNTKVTFTRTETTDGYVWDGWYVGTTKVSDSDTYTLTLGASSAYVYPTWKPKTVWLNYNLGTATTPSGKVAYEATMGESYTLDVPVLSGYDFGGWFYQSKGQRYYLTDETGESYTYYDYYVSTEELTISPAWGVTMRTVTFDWDDGLSTKTTAKIENGNKVSQPTNPTKKGYTFVGWFNGTDEWRFDTDTVTADVTLTAHWTVNKYKYYLSAYTNWGTLDYYVNDSIKGTLSGDNDYVELELDFGTPIQLKANPYKGRVFGYFEYDNENECDDYYDEEMTDTFTYASDTSMYCDFYTSDEMKYFQFTSDFTNVTINGSNSSYTSVTELVVPKYVNQIKDGALAKFVNLTSITLPYTGLTKNASSTEKALAVVFGTTSITGTKSFTPRYVESGTLKNLSTRYIPSSLKTVIITDETEIAPAALYGLELNKIELNEGVTKLGSYSLGYNYVYNIALPSTLTTIEDHALMRYTNTVSYALVVPNSVTYIGKGAFANCPNYTLSVPFIGSGYSATGEQSLLSWFYADSTIWAATVEQKTSSSNTVEGKISTYLKDVTITADASKNYKVQHGAFMNAPALEKVTYSNSYSIPSYCFYGCTKLSTLIGVLDNVTYISNYSFYGCTSLTSITCDMSNSGSLTIAGYAFKNSGITNLIFDRNNSLNLLLYAEAFANCTKLKSIKMKSDTYKFGVYLGGSSIFSGCSELESFTSNWLSYAGSNASSLDGYTSIFKDCIALKSVDLGNVYVINQSMFEGCAQLTSVNFKWSSSSTAKKIVYASAFKDCTSLKEIAIPTNTQEVGGGIFEGCSSLESITIPFVGKDRDCSTTDIDTDYQYGYWFGTTEKEDMGLLYQKATSSTNIGVYIPKTSMTINLTDIVNIPAHSFRFGNSNFSSIGNSYNYNINITGYNSSSTSHIIGDCAFYGMYYTYFNIANGLTDIGNNSFVYCYNVFSAKSLNGTLPNTVKTIGNGAFYSDFSSCVANIVIPNSVTSIGEKAFAEVKRSGITFTISKNAVLSSQVFYKSTNVLTYITYNGEATEYNSIKSKWASNWYDNSYVASVKTTDGQVYSVQ